MTNDNEVEVTENELVSSQNSNAIANSECHHDQSKRIPMRILGEDAESVRIMTGQLESAIARLFDLEQERLSLRGWVLHRLDILDRQGQTPQKLRQRATLLLHLLI